MKNHISKTPTVELLEVSEEVSVLLFLGAMCSCPLVFDESSKQRHGFTEFAGEDPSFAVPMFPAEPRDVVNDAQAAHLGADGLHAAPPETVTAQIYSWPDSRVGTLI